MSDSTASVSAWLERLKEGDEDAAKCLWDRYFRRLHGLARARLVKLRRRAAADEEDVVQSALKDFFFAVRADRYADLHGRESLWRVLAVFVANKAKTLIDRETAKVRGAGRVRGDSALVGPAGGSSVLPGLEGVPSPDPDPRLVMEVEEVWSKFLAGLGDQEAEIACLVLEGYGTKEIAERIGLAPATVRRRRVVIRDALTAALGDGRVAPAGGARRGR